MDTVAQNKPIPYDMKHEPDAADAVADALVARHIGAFAQDIGSGTVVVVPFGPQDCFQFQGWADEGGWYAGRLYLADGCWEADEHEDAGIEIPELAGVTDIDIIAEAIIAAVKAKPYARSPIKE